MQLRTRAAAVLLGVGLSGAVAAACAPSKTPSPPPPEPPNPELSTPLTTAGSVKLPVYPPPEVPDVPPLGGPPARGKPAKPPTGPGARAALAALADVCAPAVTLKDGEEIVGCACCPPFDLCAPSKDAELVESEVVYPIDASLDGAFTASHATERALVVGACKSTVILELPDPKDPERNDPRDPKTKLHRPDARAGVRGTKCSVLADDRGVDRLVCDLVETHDGATTTTVFVYDFSKKGDDAWNKLLVSFDDAASPCTSGGKPRPFVTLEITGTEARDANGDRRTDVVLSADAHKGTACGKATTLPSDKTLSLVYTQKKDGSFEPTAETKQSLEWMNAELPKGFAR